MYNKDKLEDKKIILVSVPHAYLISIIKRIIYSSTGWTYIPWIRPHHGFGQPACSLHNL